MIRQQSWEERLAEALRQAQMSGYRSPEWHEREAVYLEWMKSREPRRSRLQMALCWLLDHAWSPHPQGGFTCSCGASCEIRPGTEINQ